MPDDPFPPDDDVNKALSAAGAVFDRLRLAGLAVTDVLASTMVQSLDREHARVSARYGETSVEAIAAASRRSVHGVLREAVKAEIQHTVIEAPVPKADAFTLHGRIVNPVGIGIPDLTVSAIDPEGKAVVYECTDASGYFRLEMACLKDSDTTAPPSDFEPCEDDDATVARAAMTPGAVPATAPAHVSLMVSTKDQVVVHCSPVTHVPLCGGVDYHEIIVATMEKWPNPCPPPPAPLL